MVSIILMCFTCFTDRSDVGRASLPPKLRLTTGVSLKMQNCWT